VSHATDIVVITDITRTVVSVLEREPRPQRFNS